jgi:hypothetical protein
MAIWRNRVAGGVASIVAGLSLTLLPVCPAHAAPAFAGCIVALYPRAADAVAMAIPGGEPVGDLHLTLLNVGIDGSPGADADIPGLLGDVAVAAGQPIEAEVFGHAVINPDSAQFRPSLAYLVGDSPGLVPIRQQVTAAAARLYRLPSQHEPWLPHITALYGSAEAVLSFTGPVVFDRLALKCDQQVTFFPLG